MAYHLGALLNVRSLSCASMDADGDFVSELVDPANILSISVVTLTLVQTLVAHSSRKSPF